MKFESITFTNFGYIDYTQNLLNSCSKNNVDLNLNVYTLDEESTDYFQKRHDKVTELDSDFELAKFLDHKSQEFGRLMIKKFESIHRSLINNDYVLYVDGDITIKFDFKDLILNESKKNRLDILFQNDKNPKKPNQINVCAGFMLIKSNEKKIKFFDPNRLNIKKIINYRTHDQTHINRNLSKFKYRVLPLEKFPNGPYFYNNYKKLDPWIIHFNYVLGHEKKELMKKYNEWYLDF